MNVFSLHLVLVQVTIVIIFLFYRFLAFFDIFHAIVKSYYKFILLILFFRYLFCVKVSGWFLKKVHLKCVMVYRFMCFIHTRTYVVDGDGNYIFHMNLIGATTEIDGLKPCSSGTAVCAYDTTSKSPEGIGSAASRVLSITGPY